MNASSTSNLASADLPNKANSAPKNLSEKAQEALELITSYNRLNRHEVRAVEAFWGAQGEVDEDEEESQFDDDEVSPALPRESPISSEDHVAPPSGQAERDIRDPPRSRYRRRKSKISSRSISPIEASPPRFALHKAIFDISVNVLNDKAKSELDGLEESLLFDIHDIIPRY